MSSNIDTFSRTARYSGSARPAWRMNHTGVRAAGSSRHASRNGATATAGDLTCRGSTRGNRRTPDGTPRPLLPFGHGADGSGGRDARAGRAVRRAHGQGALVDPGVHEGA